MKEFLVLPESKLNEEAFDRFPVWSEHYDWDEIEEIERWGLDREYVLDLFSQNSPGNEHCVYTMLESNPFPPRMRIFIRAMVRTLDGHQLKGFAMNEDAYVLTVFHRGKTFPFSRHPALASYNKTYKRQLMASLGASSDIFPLCYETGFNDADGHPIAGTFVCGGPGT
ncbi:hypothetical protein [Dyella mobilis]|uniref:Uncharacterized protein n=1 Tax=Dyella mobilis TaxID=1849582 RepID=A0ABS2KHS6_9GAMM|nr:hypothetical protein [Dyella mobilis]MBM7130681.1 hypothetical protein [Dyella mobilis]GLQ97305.1 hypothetical protein GCM10007863_17250 [Dyella mobilis]